MTIRFTFLLAAAVAGTPAWGQLCLITGSPSPKSTFSYPSSLIEVSADGTLKAIARIADGTEWITLSYDWRLAVILSKYPENQIKVLDMDSASIVKVCKDPPSPIGGLMDQWLIDSPSVGPAFAEYLVGNDMAKGWLRGMALSRSVACDQSFTRLDGTEARFATPNGWAGVSTQTVADRIGVGLKPDGGISTWISGVTGYLNFHLPSTMVDGMRQPFATALINDSHVLALVVGDASDTATRRLVVLRKRDNAWRRVAIDSEDIAWVRGFGNFVAVVQSQRKSAQHPTSAGAADWRRLDSFGPAVTDLFLGGRAVFPGKLFLYDVDNEKILTIITDQGDSEILLVEENAVYFRVSNRVYRGEVTESGISRVQIVATGEAIRDAHWAFLRR